MKTKSKIYFDFVLINFYYQVLAFLRGDLKMTEYSFLKQVTIQNSWIILVPCPLL